MAQPVHTEQERELVASAPWLDDEHVVLLDDDDRKSQPEAEKPKRYDETQRIWRSRSA